MAYPALRQPKFLHKLSDSRKAEQEENFVILTLKNDTKLVVNSDAYHGIVADEEMYRCVYCGTCMELDSSYKELHKNTLAHHSAMNTVPYVEEFAENLVRKIKKNVSYCLICNVTVPSFFVARHVFNEAHQQEMAKASTRALAYKQQSVKQDQ